MSRPKPTVLLEAINKHSYKAEQVLEADAIYSVFFDGKPINLTIPEHHCELPWSQVQEGLL